MAVFRPDESALDAMRAAYAAGLRLPIGWTGGLDAAATGFEHVRAGRPGRAVLQLAAADSVHAARDESEAVASA
ncbi:hypothetical protein JJB11_21365 [Ramlibacter ginsenosidimutans]|uniref:Uncharacterized protein n=1 Tax=Ramlibacter ginsenosidimutans TaxID=502333 RepID=A0A934WPR2_9BURK|nr:hypothetical protein [Ramlibacter ginsenosidimutans]MBK6008658.1 hypothetical protein [Ramlibacter ginsenosidimutans]